MLTHLSNTLFHIGNKFLKLFFAIISKYQTFFCFQDGWRRSGWLEWSHPPPSSTPSSPSRCSSTSLFWSIRPGYRWYSHTTRFTTSNYDHHDNKYFAETMTWFRGGTLPLLLLPLLQLTCPLRRWQSRYSRTIIISFFSISRLVSEFEHPGLLNLTHVAVDRGSIYLAGGNVLYQLDQVI